MKTFSKGQLAGFSSKVSTILSDWVAIPSGVVFTQLFRIREGLLQIKLSYLVVLLKCYYRVLLLKMV